ncbi:flavin reductase family protein [Glycomyces luteolus]|uniref:Flavin reductase family protein n=1 Tax=Glycomyces luteolus TaxID=2670330 RepID=A0A9X3PC50_9ACTN|nr:flavin reductase family protein [Glycomyces luteolus]MDA1360992.1 flavin reductase family protein [Glycomyces luteolus]
MLTAAARTAAHAGVAPDDYRSLFRSHPAGVTVICADAGYGPAGFTATSLASVSLAPPLVSFAVATVSSVWATFAAAESFTAHFLAADQHDLAARFAARGADRFGSPTAWSRLETGEPVLHGAPARLRAVVQDRFEVGDHHLVIGLVTDIESDEDRDPLVYHAGGYCAAAPIR